ncbi:hypothetical protein [Mycobacterium sp. IDR2000157661]|uniref:hypothetical protein n=1 Tax=Mycobacterium sp. IDR2000157661 TaxID=2867005 RepID=UPI001EEE421C|nr:hypothetical protein [Mycobacterium sp. IDR2000157661]ULE34719.1 hypothetical protein K3G64_09095 [Mycobacterium sp. IDR2000157661]
MLIAAVLCLCAAVATAGLGLWSLRRPTSGDPVQAVLSSVAPTQLAAAAMLAAGGVVGLAAPGTGLVVLIVCVLGAAGTIAAGSWQSATAVAAGAAETARARAEAVAATGGCGSACASCTLPCS